MEVREWIDRLLAAVELIAESQRQIANKVARVPLPGEMRIRVFKETEMGLIFKLTLPEPGASDVIQRDLSVAIDGGVVFSGDVIGQSEVADVAFAGSDGATVTATLIDIDDAGNSSRERISSFTLSDTIAPPQPGEIGLVITEET